MTTMDIGRATHVVRKRLNLGFLARLDGLFGRMAERRRERATLIELARMDAYLLRDMGIEPGDIYDALEGRHSSLQPDPEELTRTT